MGLMRFTVSGMNCAACSARVEKAVSSIPGVDSCSVNLLTGDLMVSGKTEPEAVMAAVTGAGYGCSPLNGKKEAEKEADVYHETEKLLKKCLAVSAGLLLLLMYFSMGVVMYGFPVPGILKNNPVGTALCEMLISAAVLLINKRFFVSGFRGLAHGAPNMDTLVAMGSSVSWIYSLVLTFLMTADAASSVRYLHGLYFESSAMIPTLITVGKLLEARSKGKTTDAVKSLMKLKPAVARLLKGDAEVIVPAADLSAGDMFILKPGDSVPADGIVISGESAVDESILTGESLPVEKQADDNIYAASVNRQGHLVCRAVRTGEDTALSKIIGMVNDAAASKAPIARIADRVSGVFVPVVIGIAAAVFLIWYLGGENTGFALSRAISVLVISCPCALGLATPVAIMVGSGTAAEKGILFKTSEALEQTGKIRFAAFDKTGTVTEGKPSVTDVIAAVDKKELLTAAASLEKQSEHPLAEAITEYCRKQGIVSNEITGFIANGSMVSGKLGEAVIKGGSRKAVICFPLPSEIREKEKALSSEGKTIVYFTKDDSLLGIIALSDRIRESSAEAVRLIRELGITPVMITGDNEAAARHIAQKAGIERIYAGVLPGEKAAVIEKLKNDGLTMMVGDGINDAVALKAADIGMAIGAGADVAVDAADVVLIRSDLQDAVTAVMLSRRVLANIKQNLFWAFFYNCLCIPLAAGAFIRPFGIMITPVFGAAAMSLSSFFVVSNALRLKRFKTVSEKDLKKEKENMTVTLKIDGMMCPHCEARVKKALEGVEGVSEAVVSHVEGTAVITGNASEELLRKAVEDAGYEVK